MTLTSATGVRWRSFSRPTGVDAGNLGCLPAHTRDGVLHLPVCSTGNFDRQGNARHFEMPDPQRPLGPLTYLTVAIWGPLVSCPRNCKAYRNQTAAKLLKDTKRLASWLFENLVKPTVGLPPWLRQVSILRQWGTRPRSGQSGKEQRSSALF